MARPEHQMAAGDGRGRLRASDADREHVIDALKAAYVYGLVTGDEFDARISKTFAATQLRRAGHNYGRHPGRAGPGAAAACARTGKGRCPGSGERHRGWPRRRRRLCPHRQGPVPR